MCKLKRIIRNLKKREGVGAALVSLKNKSREKAWDRCRLVMSSILRTLERKQSPCMLLIWAGRREESCEPTGSGEESTGAVGGRDHSSKPTDPVVHLAFGDTPDFVLKEGVAFVEREGSIKLVESPNISYSSPLLVFCKNNTKLQEDIRHAIDNTRSECKFESRKYPKSHIVQYSFYFTLFKIIVSDFTESFHK